MKKALLLVAALMALQTSVYAAAKMTCSKCSQISCKKQKTFEYCEENCKEHDNFAACNKAHEKQVKAEEKKAESTAKIEKEAVEDLEDVTAADSKPND